MMSSPISIPEYFIQFIDRNIDLTRIPKICCLFHGEDIPPPSYPSEKELWRCFDACKVDGGVIVLHQRDYRLRSYREVEDSLYKLLSLRVEGLRRQVERDVTDEHAAAFKAACAKAAMVACTAEDWDGLDCIMS